MVTLVRPHGTPYRCEFGVAPLEQIANNERRMPEEFLAAGSGGVTPAFVNYAAPLLGPAPEAFFQLA